MVESSHPRDDADLPAVSFLSWQPKNHARRLMVYRVMRLVISAGSHPRDVRALTRGPRKSVKHVAGLIIVAVLAPVVAVCGLARAADPHDITLTLVRHAQSAGNASGLIDTSTPGPELTVKGWCQAMVEAEPLSSNHYDGVHASTMIRTQETATPTAQALGRPIDVLPGLREIEAGQFEGQPEADALTYMAAPIRWLHGDLSARIAGSLNGNEFEARFNEAVQHIYDSGEVNPVAFSHGGAIMFWTLMNVRDADLSLLRDKQLPNMGRVVLTGNPVRGWTLIEWDADPPPC
jgi:broad specificity phosphatase PhoE